MRLLVIVVAALATLGLAAFGVVASRTGQQDGWLLAARDAGGASPAATSSIAASLQSPITAPSMPPPPKPGAANRLGPAQGTVSNTPGPAPANAAQAGPAKQNISACDKPGGMGLSRVVQIDASGGPTFGVGQFEHHEFLRDKEVVLTFDTGPRPQTTAAVLKTLAEYCLKATFFELGERAIRHPELVKQVAAAGNTIGSYTWSYTDLARKPYATDLDAAKAEIEMGFSAVRMAAGAPIAPFFRFPDLREPPKLLTYLAGRNIAVFSTDIDSFDFKLHRPEKIIETVMGKLKRRGNGIILLQDSEIATAQALPALLQQLKADGYKVVHMVPKEPAITLAKYDAMIPGQDKVDVSAARPERSVVKTISGD